MPRATSLLLAFLVLGCKGSREKEIVGTWSSGQSQTTVAEDKTFKSAAGPMAIQGTWSVEGDDFTFVPKTLNGKPVAELKANLSKNMAAVPVQARQFVEDLDKPNVMTLSADGKTMTTNKAKDKNSAPAQTWTKS